MSFRKVTISRAQTVLLWFMMFCCSCSGKDNIFGRQDSASSHTYHTACFTPHIMMNSLVPNAVKPISLFVCCIMSFVLHLVCHSAAQNVCIARLILRLSPSVCIFLHFSDSSSMPWLSSLSKKQCPQGARWLFGAEVALLPQYTVWAFEARSSFQTRPLSVLSVSSK